MGSFCDDRCNNSVMFSKVDACFVRFYINLHDPGDPEKGPMDCIGQKF